MCCKILFDFIPYFFLSRGQVKRQLFQKRFCRNSLRDGYPLCLTASSLFDIKEARLQDQQFFKYQTIPAFLHLSGIRRKMNVTDRVGRTAEVIVHHHMIGQPLFYLISRILYRHLPVTHLGLRNAFRQWINRQDAPYIVFLAHLMKFRMGHLTPPIVQRDLSEQRILLSHEEIVLQILCIEKDQLH